MRTGRRLAFARAACLLTIMLAASGTRTSAASFTEGLSGYSVVSWSEADGRPLGSVYGIAQAEDGYLWIGSDAGLLRFDGWRFLPWAAASNTQSTQRPATVLAAGSGGALYVAFAGRSAVYEVRGNTLRVVG